MVSMVFKTCTLGTNTFHQHQHLIHTCHTNKWSVEELHSYYSHLPFVADSLHTAAISLPLQIYIGQNQDFGRLVKSWLRVVSQAMTLDG